MNVSRSFIGFALAALCLDAQALKPGPQVLTFLSDVDDTDQPYGLYLPKNYDPSRKYPLVISLHGAGSNHRLNLRRVFGRGNLPGETDAEATRYFPALRDVDFIVASPLARGTMGYQGIPEADVYDVLADVKNRFRIDEDRVYLTGLSMGGGGTLWLGLTRPDVWAAIAPVCPAPPPDAIAFAPNALNLPAHFFHGAIDPVVNSSVSREWVAKLKELGSSVEYIEYPGVRHNSWENAYRDAAIFTWFSQFKRDRFPDRVRFTTDRYKYNAAYWVKLDALASGSLTHIDAHFTAPNRIEIATEALDAFTLALAGHPRYTPARPLSVTIDGKAVRVRGKVLSFSKAKGAWTNAAVTPPAKGPGREGPISDALARHHIYVYGTAGNPSPEEMAARREMAAKGADWSTPRSRLLLSLRVLPDSDVKPSDIDRANLVLFGTKETNSLIAKLAARLPLELNAGAADYGLVYVFPHGSRYVVVNSGLPWWTGVERLPRPTGFRFLPVIPAVASGFGDFVLFKGSLEEMIVNGRFDSGWRVPRSDAAKLRATGAVVIKSE